MSTFSKGDSACELESAIASSRGVDRPQVLSSLRDSQSPNSSFTILESQAESENQAQHLESSFSKGDSALLKKHRLTPTASLVLGNHSGDFKDFGGTADSCSPLKSLKNTASPTATPRILEEENQASLSLRADNGGEAIHNQKVDSSKAPRILEEENQASLSLRADNGGEAIHNQKVDSSNDYSASAEFMDCHAIATALARNDRKNATSKNMDCHAIATALARNDRKNATSKKADSSNEADSKRNAKNLSDSQAAGFLMKKRGCAVASKEIRLECLSTQRATNSPLFRKKPTPKPPKAESLKAKPKPKEQK